MNLKSVYNTQAQKNCKEGSLQPLYLNVVLCIFLSAFSPLKHINSAPVLPPSSLVMRYALIRHAIWDLYTTDSVVSEMAHIFLV